MSPKHDMNTYIAIRWYVNLIENLALSTYAGYPGREGYIMSYLKSAATSLEMLSKGPGTQVQGAGLQEVTRAAQVTISSSEPDTDCPWQTCKDGSCRPSCTISPK